jgi:hypothetical protein
MEIPAKITGDVTMQGVPFAVGPNTPGIVAIVVLEVAIAQDGRAHGFSIKSGDPQYVGQAEEYVRQWQFFRMATTLPMTIVFFKIQQYPCGFLTFRDFFPFSV